MIMENMNCRWVYAECPEVEEYLCYVNCDLVVTRKQHFSDFTRNRRLEKLLLEQSTNRNVLATYYTSIYPNKKFIEKIVRLGATNGSSVTESGFLFILRNSCTKKGLDDHLDYLVKCVIKYFGNKPEQLVSAYADLKDKRIIDALLKHKNAIKQWYELTTFCYVPEVIEAIKTSKHPERNKYWAACRRWGIQKVDKE